MPTTTASLFLPMCAPSPWSFQKPLTDSNCPPPPCRPLIKLHIVWKKDGALLSNGISDYNRRLTITNPMVSDAGYYECEAMLRSSSVAPVTRGAYLSVLGESEQVMGFLCYSRGRARAAIAAVWQDAIPTVARSRPLILSPAPSPAEPPQFVREPERHITAEMEKVVDIPCRAKGNTEA